MIDDKFKEVLDTRVSRHPDLAMVLEEVAAGISNVLSCHQIIELGGLASRSPRGAAVQLLSTNDKACRHRLRKAGIFLRRRKPDCGRPRRTLCFSRRLDHPRKGVLR